MVVHGIMKNLAEYANLDEFTVAKECNKYLFQTKAVDEVKRKMVNVKEQIEDWLTTLKEGTL